MNPRPEFCGCSFGIAVQSGRFSGFADCVCSYRAVQTLAAEHITESGVLAEDRTDSAHTLKFQFRTDQTVYPQFIRALKSL